MGRRADGAKTSCRQPAWYATARPPDHPPSSAVTVASPGVAGALRRRISRRARTSGYTPGFSRTAQRPSTTIPGWPARTRVVRDRGPAPTDRPGISWEACVAADHYRLPRPVAPSPGIQLGAVRPSAADAVRGLLLAPARAGWLEVILLGALWLAAVGIRLPYLWSVPALGTEA